ncbi:MAG: hypothetical protein Q4E67_08400 [Planctomycetia bacterium]|nr:hypothetical protein [Planctomycetia bacterium]
MGWFRSGKGVASAETPRLLRRHPSERGELTLLWKSMPVRVGGGSEVGRWLPVLEHPACCAGTPLKEGN